LACGWWVAYARSVADEKTGGTMKLNRSSGTPNVHALRVKVTRGPDLGASAVVDQRGVIVGRSGGAGLRLTDLAVSSFHVELVARPDGLFVRDLSSHNGTFFAGARIASAVVPPESVLEVGASTLTVEPEAGFAPSEDERASFGPLRCASLGMRTVFARLSRIAPTELSILLEGPAGTGKEVAARAIHEASPRAKGPFVVLDCASVPSDLAESVLFGAERAGEPRSPGVLEAADCGTLLLKEPGELSADVQPKLLSMVETRRVRVLASTRRDLRERVNASTFREDLYLSLAQARVFLPPLGDRTEDIPPLTHHFLKSLPADVEGARTIAKDALEELGRREYRGNVRELRSTVERASLLARGATITTGDLAFERLLLAERERTTGTEPTDIAPFKDAKRTLVDEFERDYLKALLLRTGDNLSRASAISGVERHHLRNLFRKHALWEK
jgi:DNA-binding NtrC family response regulator